MSSHTEYAGKFPDLFAAAKAVASGARQTLRKTTDGNLVYSANLNGQKQSFDAGKIIESHEEANSVYEQIGEKKLANAERVSQAISDMLEKLYQMEALKGIEMSKDVLEKTAKALGDLTEV